MSIYRNHILESANSEHNKNSSALASEKHISAREEPSVNQIARNNFVFLGTHFKAQISMPMGKFHLTKETTNILA